MTLPDHTSQQLAVDVIEDLSLVCGDVSNHIQNNVVVLMCKTASDVRRKQYRHSATHNQRVFINVMMI